MEVWWLDLWIWRHPKRGFTIHNPIAPVGYVSAINASACAEVSLKLGSGRMKASDKVDHSVGLQLYVDLGSRLNRSEGHVIKFTVFRLLRGSGRFDECIRMHIRMNSCIQVCMCVKLSLINWDWVPNWPNGWTQNYETAFRKITSWQTTHDHEHM